MKFKLVFIIIALSGLSLAIIDPEVGSEIDNYNGIPVYYNGYFTNTFGRNTTDEGYNLGLKWQCIEFVKRYYYEVYDHKMPDSYGHAKDYFEYSGSHHIRYDDRLVTDS